LLKQEGLLYKCKNVHLRFVYSKNKECENEDLISVNGGIDKLKEDFLNANYDKEHPEDRQYLHMIRNEILKQNRLVKLRIFGAIYENEHPEDRQYLHMIKNEILKQNRLAKLIII
jgi:hypothetical protein